MLIIVAGAYYQAMGQSVPGHCSNVGTGEGAGYNINLGWDCISTQTPMNDADYAEAWAELLIPVATQFQPQLILIAAGFDSAKGDPEGECLLTPQGYAHLTSKLMSVGAPIVVALEGGYPCLSVRTSN